MDDPKWSNISFLNITLKIWLIFFQGNPIVSVLKRLQLLTSNCFSSSILFWTASASLPWAALTSSRAYCGVTLKNSFCIKTTTALDCKSSDRLVAANVNSIHLSPLLGGLLGLIGGGLLTCPQTLHLLSLTLDHLWVPAVKPSLSQSLVELGQILHKSCNITKRFVGSQSPPSAAQLASPAGLCLSSPAPVCCRDM